MLLLEGSPAYYGARGFTPAALLGLLPASVRTPAAAFQAVRFDGLGDRGWPVGSSTPTSGGGTRAWGCATRCSPSSRSGSAGSR